MTPKHVAALLGNGRVHEREGTWRTRRAVVLLGHGRGHEHDGARWHGCEKAAALGQRGVGVSYRRRRDPVAISARNSEQQGRNRGTREMKDKIDRWGPHVVRKGEKNYMSSSTDHSRPPVGHQTFSREAPVPTRNLNPGVQIGVDLRGTRSNSDILGHYSGHRKAPVKDFQ